MVFSFINILKLKVMIAGIIIITILAVLAGLCLGAGIFLSDKVVGL